MSSYSALPPIVRRRVVVTGLGAVTPLGVNMPATMSRLLQGDRGARVLRETPFFFPPGSVPLKGAEKAKKEDAIFAALPCAVACPVVDGSEEDAHSLKSRFAPTSREPRSHRFATCAVAEALTDSGLLLSSSTEASGIAAPPAVNEDSRFTPLQHYDRSRIGVNIGMGITSLADVTETALHLFRDDAKCNYNKVHPFFVPKILGNMAAGSTAIRYGLRGPIGSSVGACATGAQCIGDAARWIHDGVADAAVCGATEACINPISIAGFCRMRALSTSHNCTPCEASRPFDAQRGGFVMGEGAAILVLESLESALKRGAKIYAEVRGYGTSADSYHITSPHPDGIGAKQCVGAALLSGGVSAEDVVYVNAHATGTPVGDEIELSALQEVFHSRRGPDAPLLVSSSKGALGHLLGAAGSVEAAISVWSLHHRCAPPNVNLKDPVAHDTSIVSLITKATELCRRKERRPLAVLSTSFGFGGVNTALLFTDAPVTDDC